MSEPRPACDGEYETFFALMDNPGNRWIRKEAGDFCSRCPLVATCIPENIARGGFDAEWAIAVTRDLERRRKGHEVAA